MASQMLRLPLCRIARNGRLLGALTHFESGAAATGHPRPGSPDDNGECPVRQQISFGLAVPV